MAIDHSIYFQLQSPDIVGSIKDGINIREGLDKRAEAKEQMQRQKVADEAYKSGVVTNPDGTTSVDKQKTLSALAKIGGKEYMEGEERFASRDKMQNDSFIGGLQRAKGQMEFIGQNLNGVKDQNSWNQFLGNAQKVGIDISKEPQLYDPNYVRQTQAKALTYGQHLDQVWKLKEYEQKEREIGSKRAEAVGKAGKDQVSLATELRKERSNLPTTKATAEISSAYNKMQSAANAPSAAGDMSLVFGYMKMLDPGSTVREGEQASAQNAAGVPTRVMNMYNSILRGERLAPEQRQDFLGQSRKIYDSQLAVQKQVDGQFASLAQKSGIDPKDVLLNFEAQNPVSQKLESLPDQELDALYKQMGGK